MNSASFYAPLKKKRLEIPLPIQHSEDECDDSTEDELQENLPGEFVTDEEDESESEEDEEDESENEEDEEDERENLDEDEGSESAEYSTETGISRTV